MNVLYKVKRKKARYRAPSCWIIVLAVQERDINEVTRNGIIIGMLRLLKLLSSEKNVILNINKIYQQDLSTIYTQWPWVSSQTWLMLRRLQNCKYILRSNN